MKKALAAAVVILTLAAPAAKAQEVTLQGPVTCGDWFNPSHNTYSRAWVLGFMSGIIAGTAPRFGDPFAKNLKSSQVYLWMDNYCRSKPLDGVADGVVSLLNELKNRR